MSSPDAAAYRRGRAAALAASEATALDDRAARERRVNAFAASLLEHVRQPADDYLEALGVPDPSLAMIQDFRDALEAGDALLANAGSSDPRAGHRTTGAARVEGETETDADGVESRILDRGHTPFFLESPKAATFDNFVGDEGGSEEEEEETTETAAAAAIGASEDADADANAAAEA